MTLLRKSLVASTIASMGTLAALPAFAQSAAQAYSCTVNLAYEAAPLIATPPSATAVPGLGTLSVAALAGLIAWMAWRKRKTGGFRAMSVMFMMGAAVLATQGGNSLVQSVRAANPYSMEEAAGGTVATSMNLAAIPAPQAIVNNTAVRMRITMNGNRSETAAGSCAVNAEIAPGDSCTTQAVCEALQVFSVTQDPQVGCDKDGTPLDTYSMNAGVTTFFSFTPAITSTPVFDPVATPEPTVAWSGYVPDSPIWIENAAHDDLEAGNLEAVGSGTATIIATAPAGAVFSPSLSSTYTWSTRYTGCSTGESVPN